MNKFPCPSCGKPLLWNGIAKSANKYNLEGKHWYQYAARRIYCKHCGTRLRGPLEGYGGWLLLAWLLFSVFIQPFIIQPLTEEFGFGVPVVFFVVVLSASILAWSRGRYKKWK
jgi:hypothetical protein